MVLKTRDYETYYFFFCNEHWRQTGKIQYVVYIFELYSLIFRRWGCLIIKQCYLLLLWRIHQWNRLGQWRSPDRCRFQDNVEWFDVGHLNLKSTLYSLIKMFSKWHTNEFLFAKTKKNKFIRTVISWYSDFDSFKTLL